MPECPVIIQQIILQGSCHTQKGIPVVDIQLLGMTDVGLYGFPVLGDRLLRFPGKGFEDHRVLPAGDADDVLAFVKRILLEFRDQFLFTQLIVPEIRCPDMPAIISTANGLGATATPMAATEQYLAMQQGVVDGAEHTLSGFCAWNIQELCKTLMLTNHAREVTFTMISRDCMDKLTEENQQILLDAVNSAAAWANQQTNEDEETLMAQFREEYGMELVEVDAEAFRQSLEPVSEQLSADDPELFAAIQGLE